MASYPDPPGERLLAIREYERMPEDESRSELVRGRVVREPLPGAEHGGVTMEIGSRMAAFAREHGLGRVFTARTGFVLVEDSPTVRGPDAAFVAADRLPANGLPTGYLPFAPDLAVEVSSPSNGESELRRKVLDYLDAGSHLVWVVDPGTRTVTVYRSRNDIRLLGEDDELDGGDVLPGFRVAVGDLFAD